MARDPGDAPAAGNALELLPLALGRPGEALSRARAIIATDPGPYDASIARQVIGIVLREFGDVDAAVRELRTAVRLARLAGSQDREADVLATLGVALTYAGRTAAGLAALDKALSGATGLMAGRVMERRGIALWTVGRHQQALDDLRRAVTIARRGGDTIWAARALTARGFVHLALNATGRASADFAAAEALFAATSQELERAYARQNCGLAAFRSGDLPAALSHLDEAAGQYRSLGVPIPDLSIDRCAVLLAAGLPAEALRTADAAVRDLQRTGGQPTKSAELLLTAATAALGCADPQTALLRAEAARRLFRSQRRAWWQAHAAFAAAQARYAIGPMSVALLHQAERAAATLEVLGSCDAPRARLLAGRVALAAGRQQAAQQHLASAARTRIRRGPALARAEGWLAEGLRAEAAASPRRMLGACRRGFDVIDQHMLTLGATELRALATARGAELAALAQRYAAAAGRPRLLLQWSERWRATALTAPPIRPVYDQELQAELAAVRSVASRLELARAAGRPAGQLEREQMRLETAIRDRAMRARGGGGSGSWDFSVPRLLAELGPARLAQLIEVDGDLHVLVCGGGRVRQFPAGRLDDAIRETDYARFALSRLAHGLAAGSRGSQLTALAESGGRLQHALLGAAARHLGSGPVVIVPPARLHAVPWAVLPSLRDRALSVAPSARAWLRARAAVPPGRRDLVLIRGPGLGPGAGEVAALAAESGPSTVLGSTVPGGRRATVARVLDAIDGAWLVHIAAHGTFRSDSPLFSSLRMDDGPLTVHDFERLRRAPHLLILPSCDSGLVAPIGADELLGLTAALVPLGTAGIVASVVQVNDMAAAGLMVGLHRRLRGGSTLSEALRSARADADGDPVQVATALSFVALGAG